MVSIILLQNFCTSELIGRPICFGLKPQFIQDLKRSLFFLQIYFYIPLTILCLYVTIIKQEFACLYMENFVENDGSENIL